MTTQPKGRGPEPRDRRPPSSDFADAPDQQEDPVDEAAVESFPASDPPAFTPTHLGDPAQPPEDRKPGAAEQT